jgi:hypothetical protein
MSTPGTAIPGTNVPSGALVTPGGAQGVQGITGPNGPSTPSANTGNLLTAGSDNLLYLPASAIQPVIWSARLRNFNAVGNPGVEVDQINVGQTVNISGSYGAKIIDRWFLYKGGTAALYTAQIGTTTNVIPGTNFNITSHGLFVTITTPQATLAATDSLRFTQIVEGPRMRELISDVHSLSILVSSSVSPVHFSICLRDSPTTKSIVYLCTYTGGGSQLITIPNIPVWASGGNWNTQPGNQGYIIEVTLAAGSTYIAPAAGSWQNGMFLGAPGMDNWLANAANSNFILYFLQHEPGAQCTTLIDKPFFENQFECCRYFQKSYEYATVPGAATVLGQISGLALANNPPIAIPVSFVPKMAKTPTVTGFSPNNGAINNVYDNTVGVNRVINTGGWGASQCGFSGFGTSTTNSGQANYNYHYTADTGW